MMLRAFFGAIYDFFAFSIYILLSAFIFILYICSQIAT